MGEVLKDVARLNNNTIIELNKATYKGGPRYIHVQNDQFRFCVTEQVYIEMAAAVQKAVEKFRHMKGMDHDK